MILVVGASAEAQPAAAAPVDDGRVESSPPKTTHSPDGWTLTMSARDETQRVTAPLTTAISTREYEVGGIYSGSLVGPEEGDEEEGDEGAHRHHLAAPGGHHSRGRHQHRRRVTIGLKPGLINTFIRSYAFLTRSTEMSDAVAAWYGVTKKV
jgi:hypothetical protein